MRPLESGLLCQNHFQVSGKSQRLQCMLGSTGVLGIVSQIKSIRDVQDRPNITIFPDIKNN